MPPRLAPTSTQTEDKNGAETAPTPKTSEIGLKTRHVLIDTSVYRKFGFNLRSKLFKEFTSIALSHQIKIHIDPILSKEIDRGLAEIAAKLVAQHKQYARLQNRWNSRFPKPEVIVPLKIGGMVAAARREFDFVMKIVGRTSHGLGDQTVAEALNHYFERKAPFEREGSREFPDYFILRAAEQQAASVGGIYVISLDDAMLQAAASFKGLYPINGLEAFLQIIASLEDPEIQNVVERFVGDEDAVFRVGEVLADALREEDLRYDGSRFEDFQVTGFDLESIDDPVDFVVISANEDTVVLSGELYGEGHAEGEAEVSYDQGPDEPPFDTIEKFEFHARTMARVILTFNRRTFEDVELEITQPFVYVREYGKGY